MAGSAAQPTVVDVSPARLDGWLERFAQRHGAVTSTASAAGVIVTAADGAVADCQVPFPPLQVRDEGPYLGLLAHVRQPWRVGVLLVRRGGFAVGVFAGERLQASKVGSRHVQGKSKAGGWSQQRFARRREQQARVAFAAAADAADGVFASAAGDLDAVVCGGDRFAVDAVLADPRLAQVRALARRQLYSVPDPRRKVLDQMPEKFLAVRITVTEPAD